MPDTLDLITATTLRTLIDTETARIDWAHEVRSTVRRVVRRKVERAVDTAISDSLRTY